jgi:antitoxin ParD1/3/4
VREALRDWKSRQDYEAEALKSLKRLVQDGIDSGPSRFSSMDEIIAESRRQFALERKKAT